MKKIFLTLTILSCFCFAECKKNKNTPPPDNPYGLPNATQEGKNIFACRINGENWISEKGIYNMGGGYEIDTFGVWGSPKTSGYFERITIRIKETALEKIFLVDSIKNQVLYSSNQTCMGYSGSYVTHAVSTIGLVQVTMFDSTNKIISGIFDCEIPIPNFDTLYITDGRFDIRYH